MKKKLVRIIFFAVWISVFFVLIDKLCREASESKPVQMWSTIDDDPEQIEINKSTANKHEKVKN